MEQPPDDIGDRDMSPQHRSAALEVPLEAHTDRLLRELATDGTEQLTEFGILDLRLEESDPTWRWGIRTWITIPLAHAENVVMHHATMDLICDHLEGRVAQVSPGNGALNIRFSVEGVDELTWVKVECFALTVCGFLGINPESDIDISIRGSGSQTEGIAERRSISL